MAKCPFETIKIVCIYCGDGTPFNVDGSETRSSDPREITGLGLSGIAAYLIYGGRCDGCGNPVGYAPLDQETRK